MKHGDNSDLWVGFSFFAMLFAGLLPGFPGLVGQACASFKKHPGDGFSGVLLFDCARVVEFYPKAVAIRGARCSKAKGTDSTEL